MDPLKLPLITGPQKRNAFRIQRGKQAGRSTIKTQKQQTKSLTEGEKIGYKLLRNQYAIILDIVIVVYKEQGQNEILIKRKLGLFLS